MTDIASLSSIVKNFQNENNHKEIAKQLRSFVDYADTNLQVDHLKEQNEQLQQLLTCIANVGIVRDFHTDQFKDYEKSDFPDLPETAEACFACLSILCKRVFIENGLAPDTITVAALVHLCGTHYQEFLWTNSTCIASAQELVCLLCQCFNVTDIHQLLIYKTADKLTVVQKLLARLKVSLTKNTWRRNPCSPQVYKWLLLHLKYSEIPDLLPELLPAALLFVDDHLLENKVLGILCLHHIIKNVPPTVLSWHGRAEVIFDALRHLLYTREPVIISLLHPCLLDILAGMEPDPNSSQRSVNKNSRYDELFSDLLTNMSMEQKIKLRNAYSSQLPLYIDRMGITVLTHSKRLFEVLLEYISVYDGPSETSRLNTLYALQLVIKVAWPRMPYHCGTLLKAVLKLMLDFHLNPPDATSKAKEDVIKRSEECMVLLHKCCPVKFEDLTSDLLKSETVSDYLKASLQRILDNKSK